MPASAPRPRWYAALRALFAFRRHPRAVLVVLLLLQVFQSTYGINQDIVWGHSGFHIGEYGTQAVHLRRHHSFIPAESDEFKPPRNQDLELRHPFLLHPYIAVVQSVFGERPWTARVVPLAFSVLALAGLWALVRRARDVLTAHLTVALFIGSPLNLAFSHLPEYQISALAWALWSFVGIVDTLRAPSARSITLWLVCAALAGLTDWPWFEMAAFVFLFVAWHLRPRGPISRSSSARDLRAMRWALAGFCLVVLVTFFQHFLVVHLLGQLAALRSSFNDRTHAMGWPEYRALLWSRLMLLHTPGVLAATVVWLLRAVLGRRGDLGTMLFMALLLGMTLDVKLFPGAFAFHEYRDSYWYVPVFAFALADLSVSFGRWLARRFRERREAALVPVVIAIATATALGVGAPEMLRMSRARGGSVSLADADLHVADFTMARVVHHFSRGRKVFIGGGLGGRDEMTWLIEAPHVVLSSVAPVREAIDRRQPFVALDRLSALREVPDWAAVARESQVFLLESVALMVWTPGTPPSLETARFERVKRRPIDAWLHAESTEPVIVAGADSDALTVAGEIHCPPEVSERIRRNDHPLLRQIPPRIRSRSSR